MLTADSFEMLRVDDTIAAIGTPPGERAIGMVRLSGPEALRIAAALFRPARRGGRGRRPWESHRLYYGYVVDPATGGVVDEVLLVYMRAPHRYTRQGVVESSGHGGSVSMCEILRLAIAAGARRAERGEMTLRPRRPGRRHPCCRAGAAGRLRLHRPPRRSGRAGSDHRPKRERRPAGADLQPLLHRQVRAVAGAGGGGVLSS